MTATDSTLRQPRAERWRIVAALATLGVAFAGERLVLSEAIATAVILAGVVVILTGRK
jgi:multidrug transporter EmrE-like cation transporter